MSALHHRVVLVAGLALFTVLTLLALAALGSSSSCPERTGRGGCRVHQVAPGDDPALP